MSDLRRRDRHSGESAREAVQCHFCEACRLCFHTIPFNAERQAGKLWMPLFSNIFGGPTRESNPHLPLQSQTFYPLRHLIDKNEKPCKDRKRNAFFVKTISISELSVLRNEVSAINAQIMAILKNNVNLEISNRMVPVSQTLSLPWMITQALHGKLIFK